VIRRSTRILIEAVIGVLAGFVLLAGMAIWRLSAGPVHMDFLTPYLEAVFAETKSGLSVEVGDTVLTWEGWSRTLDLRARQVEMRNAKGATIALFPDVSVTLSMRALLRGTVAPMEIEVIDARVSLVREPEGRFRLVTGAEPKTEAEGGETVGDEREFSRLVPSLVDLFLRDQDPSSPLGYLTAVRVVDGQFIVIDRRLDTIWFAPAGRMELRRHGAGVAAFMDFQVTIGTHMADANLALLFDEAQERITVAAKLSDVRADALAAVLPVPEALSGFRIPLEANIKGALTADGRLTAVSFDVTGGAGELTIPSLLPTTQSVSSFSVSGVLDGSADRLEIEQAELQFGTQDQPGPSLSLAGTVDGLSGDMSIEAEAKVRDLPSEDLAIFWPEQLVRGGRAWTLGNIERGSAKSGRLAMTARVADGDFNAIEVVKVEGGFEYEGLTVHYLKPMPPVTGVHGSAVYDGKTLRFMIADGKAGELAVKDVRVDLLGLVDKNPRIEIRGDGTGPLRAALELLDHEKLDLLDRIGIGSAGAGGQAAAALTFRFPLIRGVALKDIDVSAEAKITQGSVAAFLLDRDATDLEMALEVDRQGMQAKGTLKLAGVAAEMDWQEDFTGGAEERTVLKLEFPEIDGEGRSNLGLDFESFVEGPISASMVAGIRHDREGSVNLAANLTRARLSFPFLHWRKPPNIDGQMRLTMTLRDRKITTFDRFDLEAGTLLARGRADLLPDRFDYQNIEFDQLSFYGTTLQGTSVVREDDGLLIDLGEGVVDAASFLKDEETAEEKIQEKEASPEQDKVPLRITGRALSSVHFAEGRFLTGVDLDLERGAKGWVRVNMRGEVPRELWARKFNGDAVEVEEAAPEAKTFTMTFGPSGKDDYRLTISMNDMGAALRALDVIDTIEGGNLIITGTSPGPAPDNPVIGHIEAENYALKEAPVMNQLLNRAAREGAAGVVTDEGIAFDRLIGDFILQDGVVRTDLVRAYGGALGLTAKGTLDFETDKIDMRGTVVPAYTVNHVLGYIPLLGPLLIGGEGEGVLAVTYSIDGSISDPEVSVNPLSALTPGFLRGLFGLTGTGEFEEDSRPAAFPRTADK
jgi:hypothetical protein